MSTTPNPARIPEYQASLAELVEARDAFRTQRNDHKVRLLNRQIRAKLKWIKRARAQELAHRVVEPGSADN
jgi:hypothetical protein